MGIVKSKFRNLEHVKVCLDERGMIVEVHEFIEAEPLLTSPKKFVLQQDQR